MENISIRYQQPGNKSLLYHQRNHMEVYRTTGSMVRRHVQKICENQHTRPKFEDNYQFYSYTGAGTVLTLTASPSDVTMGGGG